MEEVKTDIHSNEKSLNVSNKNRKTFITIGMFLAIFFIVFVYKNEAGSVGDSDLGVANIFGEAAGSAFVITLIIELVARAISRYKSKNKQGK
jgi:hypothetical protein